MESSFKLFQAQKGFKHYSLYMVSVQVPCRTKKSSFTFFLLLFVLHEWIASLEVENCPHQVPNIQLWPKSCRGIQWTVVGLPKKEIAEACFAGTSDHNVWFRCYSHVHMLLYICQVYISKASLAPPSLQLRHLHHWPT